MAKKTVNKNEINLEEKLEYLGLDLDNIPKQWKEYKALKYRIPRFTEDKKYRQYRYVDVRKIQILLSPANRMEEIEKKYKNARPLVDYLDDSTEENLYRYTTFLSMLKKVNIKDIKAIAKEQKLLNDNIPFKVKYENNYLWQIYYSEATDQYFMIVSTEDINFSAFFYLIKKQIENGKDNKIFVPINYIEYTNEYLKKSEYEDIENYMWLFAKDWPFIYEVYDKEDNLSIHIVGETEIYHKVKSPYKIKLESKAEARQFYKLIKALFILQTEVPDYFTFKTKITKTGSIDFYCGKQRVRYKNLASWIFDEVELGIQRDNAIDELIEENKEKLDKYKVDIAAQEIEYNIKEKQITTFLECKKTFFGKFKYFFKNTKKKNKTLKGKVKEDIAKMKEKKADLTDSQMEKDLANIVPVDLSDKDNYNIEEIVELYKVIEEKERILKNILMDLNSLKLKNKNMAKKIENATLYIKEIESHKKSIFEFWRYSNKDEMSTLPEGEVEEVNIRKKITKTFDYETDLEKFGINMDNVVREKLTKEESDSVYITSTNCIDILNKVKIGDFENKDLGRNLRRLKQELLEQKTIMEDEDFDIFGGLSDDNTKVSTINNKKHRELPKDKFNILEINKSTKQGDLKWSLDRVVEYLTTALDKVSVTEDLPVYKAIIDDKLDDRLYNVFNINPENEMKSVLKQDSERIYFYKISLKEGNKAISFTNSIFYDNTNKTLPVGQDLSTKILVDVDKLRLKLRHKEIFKIADFDGENGELSDPVIRTVEALEFEV